MDAHTQTHQLIHL